MKNRLCPIKSVPYSGTDDDDVPSLDESGAGWRRDTRIIQKIVLLENELGRPLTMFDLFCRFDRQELDSVNDILRWLVAERGIPF